VTARAFAGRAAGAEFPAAKRLASLSALDPEARHALDTAIAAARPVRARRELQTEGRPVQEAQLIVSGWAARVRILLDGRRQFISFVLPGELVGMCLQPQPLASSTVVALTDLLVATPPSPAEGDGLGRAYRTSAALEEAFLLAQITRLGRLDAHERIIDLLLELEERLALAGLAADGVFDLPLTQEVLGDVLGLTSVHINRMLQQARRNGELDWRAGRLRLHNPAALARSVGRAGTRVSAAQPD
jgi:CRP-like cAMP-binding protein